MSDLYLPKNSSHPQIRLRQNGDKLVLTKKYPRVEGDNSVMVEDNIYLTPEEYTAFRMMDWLLTQKTRYQKVTEEYTLEIDVFEENLQGYATADFEFENEQAAKDFVVPDFCWLEITHIEWMAWWMIAGKTNEEIQQLIVQYNEQK